MTRFNEPNASLTTRTTAGNKTMPCRVLHHIGESGSACVVASLPCTPEALVSTEVVRFEWRRTVLTNSKEGGWQGVRVDRSEAELAKIFRPVRATCRLEA